MIKQKLIVLSCIFSIFFLGCNSTAKINLPDRGICAHRGANNTHPENTIPAFREAIRLGAHMIEFDVQKTNDGRLVIIHDKTVDRTTNGSGKVSEFTFREIRALDAGSWKSEKFKGEKIPTLSEVLEIMPMNVWLNVHIKGDAGVAKAAAELIVKEKRVEQSFLACKPEAAAAAKEIDKRIKICNMDRTISSAQYVSDTIVGAFEFIQLKDRSYGELKTHVQNLKQHKIMVNFYSSEISPQKLKNLFEAGVDFPLVNNVDEMMIIAKELGIKPLSK